MSLNMPANSHILNPPWEYNRTGPEGLSKHDQKPVLTRVTGGVNALPGRYDAFPTGHAHELNRLNALPTEEERFELIGCASTDAPRAGFQTPNPSTLTHTEGLSRKIEELNFKLASHEQKKNQELSELQNQAETAIRNMKAEIDKLKDDLDDKEDQLQISVWEEEKQLRNLARADKKLQEEMEENEVIVQEFQMLLTNERDAKKSLADDFAELQIEMNDLKRKHLEAAKEKQLRAMGETVEVVNDLIDLKSEDETLSENTSRGFNMNGTIGHANEGKGEVLEAVNDLKLKEDEILSLKIDMKSKDSRIDELCKQLLQQEQSHKEFIKKNASLEEELETKIEEAKSQSAFLEDQMGKMKFESDLQIQEMRIKNEVQINSLTDALDRKSALIDEL